MQLTHLFVRYRRTVVDQIFQIVEQLGHISQVLLAFVLGGCTTDLHRNKLTWVRSFAMLHAHTC
jgi:hypothetical protein